MEEISKKEEKNFTLSRSLILIHIKPFVSPNHSTLTVIGTGGGWCGATMNISFAQTLGTFPSGQNFSHTICYSYVHSVCIYRYIWTTPNLDVGMLGVRVDRLSVQKSEKYIGSGFDRNLRIFSVQIRIIIDRLILVLLHEEKCFSALSDPLYWCAFRILYSHTRFYHLFVSFFPSYFSSPCRSCIRVGKVMLAFIGAKRKMIGESHGAEMPLYK